MAKALVRKQRVKHVDSVRHWASGEDVLNLNLCGI